jgi:extracellular elastinolytic metalloproteinase
MYRLGSLTACL